MVGESLQRELRAVFAGEAADSLARVESMLARQRLVPADRGVLEVLFREFHTMKVGAAAAGYSVAAHALHEAESLLDAVRGAGAGLDEPGGLDALRRVVARVRGEVGAAAVSGAAPGTLAVLWPPLARATAEAAACERKFVALETNGGELEVGGATLNALHGALLHLVRNAVAHGVELPAARLAAGKSRVGRVVVDAEGGDGVVLISVSDDGRGLDRGAIARAAGADQPAEALVLRSGVSTRATADALAGRGVGLDAVAHAIAALGGDLAIESRDGLGCTVRLIVPA